MALAAVTVAVALGVLLQGLLLLAGERVDLPSGAVDYEDQVWAVFKPLLWHVAALGLLSSHHAPLRLGVEAVLGEDRVSVHGLLWMPLTLQSLLPALLCWCAANWLGGRLAPTTLRERWQAIACFTLAYATVLWVVALQTRITGGVLLRNLDPATVGPTIASLLFWLGPKPELAAPAQTAFPVGVLWGLAGGFGGLTRIGLRRGTVTPWELGFLQAAETTVLAMVVGALAACALALVEGKEAVLAALLLAPVCGVWAVSAMSLVDLAGTAWCNGAPLASLTANLRHGLTAAGWEPVKPRS